MLSFYKKTEHYRSGDLWLTDTIRSSYSYLPDGLGRVGKKTYRSFKSGKDLPPEGASTEKDVFYLNDFYDLLYEKTDIESHFGENPAEYFQSEKYYTMGPGIDFPLIMNYSDMEYS